MTTTTLDTPSSDCEEVPLDDELPLPPLTIIMLPPQLEEDESV